MNFWCVHLLQLFNVCDHNVSFPDSHRVQRISKLYFLGKTFGPNWCSPDWSFAEIGIRPMLQMVLLVCQRAFRTAFNMVSSHQTRDLECFADSSNTPWNPPTIHYPDLISTILQKYLLSLCALLSQQSHLFPICVALACNGSKKIPHKTCQIPRNCQCKWLLVSSLAPGTSFGSSGSPVKSLFYMCKTVSTVLPSLVNNHGISMIVPRFTFFIKNLLICSNQITNMFRAGHDCTSTSSARSLRYFRFQADIAIWVLWKVRIHTVPTRTRFHFCSRLHW